VPIALKQRFPPPIAPADAPLNLVADFAIRGSHDLGGRAERGCLRRLQGSPRLFRPQKSMPMSTTFDKVAEIIAETCDIPRENIKPESHAINDLEIDSLDFLDIAFAIDKAFGIKLPLEQWTQEVNDGKATTDQYFVLKNLSAQIDQLIAAKGA
jgi:acyl carrier protein